MSLQIDDQKLNEAHNLVGFLIAVWERAHAAGPISLLSLATALEQNADALRERAAVQAPPAEG